MLLQDGDPSRRSPPPQRASIPLSPARSPTSGAPLWPPPSAPPLGVRLAAERSWRVIATVLAVSMSWRPRRITDRRAPSHRRVNGRGRWYYRLKQAVAFLAALV